MKNLAASVHLTIREATGVALCARAGGAVSSPMVRTAFRIPRMTSLLKGRRNDEEDEGWMLMW